MNCAETARRFIGKRVVLESEDGSQTIFTLKEVKKKDGGILLISNVGKEYTWGFEGGDPLNLLKNCYDVTE